MEKISEGSEGCFGGVKGKLQAGSSDYLRENKTDVSDMQFRIGGDIECWCSKV
jgi:hypothetical protein